LSKQESPIANAKVSARQQCVYEGPWQRNLMANQRKERWKVHSVDYNTVADNTGLFSSV